MGVWTNSNFDLMMALAYNSKYFITSPSVVVETNKCQQNVTVVYSISNVMESGKRVEVSRAKLAKASNYEYLCSIGNDELLFLIKFNHRDNVKNVILCNNTQTKHEQNVCS